MIKPPKTAIFINKESYWLYVSFVLLMITQVWAWVGDDCTSKRWFLLDRQLQAGPRGQNCHLYCKQDFGRTFENITVKVGNEAGERSRRWSIQQKTARVQLTILSLCSPLLDEIGSKVGNSWWIGLYCFPAPWLVAACTASLRFQCSAEMSPLPH